MSTLQQTPWTRALLNARCTRASNHLLPGRSTRRLLLLLLLLLLGIGMEPLAVAVAANLLGGGSKERNGCVSVAMVQDPQRVARGVVHAGMVVAVAVARVMVAEVPKSCLPCHGSDLATCRTMCDTQIGA
jgi:hypothetical protein